MQLNVEIDPVGRSGIDAYGNQEPSREERFRIRPANERSVELDFPTDWNLQPSK